MKSLIFFMVEHSLKVTLWSVLILIILHGFFPKTKPTPQEPCLERKPSIGLAPDYIGMVTR